jgi:glucose-6-phosphate 1-epimerase
MPDFCTSDFFGLDSLRLQAPDGASAVVTCYGAQVVSWIPAGDDERIFLSSKSALDKRAPIRGGIPVVFPQFAAYGPLPKHGLLRTRDWRITHVDRGEDSARATFRVEDCSETRKLWPHGFACELSVAVNGVRLDIHLGIQNTGSGPFDFRAALHTYIRLADIHVVRLEGLHAARYRDRTNHDREAAECSEALMISGEVDRIYVDAPRQLVLREPGRSLSLHAGGFPDIVVWNPWKDKCRLLPDMPNDAYKHMLCVEAAAVARPLRLEPGEKWVGSQTLTASRTARDIA